MSAEAPTAAVAPDEELLCWHGGRLSLRPAGEPGEITVVDSWLVTDGRMRGFEAHERRFAAACGELSGIGRAEIREFLLAAMARVPGEGRWFPRAELYLAGGVPGLRFRIRPAPPQGHSVRLWLCAEPDARTRPAVKGPDLDWLAVQRASAVSAGADEAVLLSADGRVLEGSTTSILWWRGDTLCTPPEDGRLLPGTTRSELLEVADASGVPVAFENPRPAELDGLEVWAVNALHGIRPVTGWVGAGISPGPASRALRWQVYLDQLCWEVRRGPAGMIRRLVAGSAKKARPRAARRGNGRSRASGNRLPGTRGRSWTAGGRGGPSGERGNPWDRSRRAPDWPGPGGAWASGRGSPVKKACLRERIGPGPRRPRHGSTRFFATRHVERGGSDRQTMLATLSR